MPDSCRSGGLHGRSAAAPWRWSARRHQRPLSRRASVACPSWLPAREDAGDLAEFGFLRDHVYDVAFLQDQARPWYHRFAEPGDKRDPGVGSLFQVVDLLAEPVISVG